MDPFFVIILSVLAFLLVASFVISVYLCMFHTNTPKRYTNPVRSRTHSHITIDVPEQGMAYVSINPMFRTPHQQFPIKSHPLQNPLQQFSIKPQPEPKLQPQPQSVE